MRVDGPERRRRRREKMKRRKDGRAGRRSGKEKFFQKAKSTKHRADSEINKKCR